MVTNTVSQAGATEGSAGRPTTTETSPAKQRSDIQYPYYGLTKVQDIAKAVQRVAGNGGAPASELQRELNVSKTDRTWAFGIPAAVQFGLVERIGRGDDTIVKLTDIGKRIALPGNEDEARASRRDALRTPELYVRLLAQYEGAQIPTKEGLKNVLVRDYGILESMAGSAADAFLDSIKVAELISPTNVLISSGRPEKVEKAETSPETAETTGKTKAILVPDDYIIYRCKIDGGRVLELALPKQFSTADAKRLYAFLQTQVDDGEVEL